MIAKIFKTGEAGIDYLQSKSFCPVISGDPRMTQDLIEASRSKNPSTAGVLSFSEHIEDDDLKRDLCDRFTRDVLCPGIDPGDYSITWIEHQEKSEDGGVRTGLHFVMCNTHLASGKVMAPYWWKRDRGLKMAWQAMVNKEHGFSNPNDPERRQAIQINPREPKAQQELKKDLTAYIGQLAELGDVASREDVIAALESLDGVEVSRATAKSVSVAVEGHKRAIRLKGALYEQEFRFDPTASTPEGEQVQAGTRGTREELEALRKQVNSRGLRRSAEAQKLYYSPDQVRPRDRLSAPVRPDRDLVLQPPANTAAQELDQFASRRSSDHHTPTITNDSTDHERRRFSIIQSLRGLQQRARQTAQRVGGLFERLTRLGIGSHQRRPAVNRAARSLAAENQQIDGCLQCFVGALQKIDGLNLSSPKAPRKSPVDDLSSLSDDLTPEQDDGMGFSM